jgi:hypothetical protein
MKTEKEVKQAFWKQRGFQGYDKYKTHNQYNATIRSEFCFFVDYLQKDGIISQELAQNVTL